MLRLIAILFLTVLELIALICRKDLMKYGYRAVGTLYAFHVGSLIMGLAIAIAIMVFPELKILGQNMVAAIAVVIAAVYFLTLLIMAAKVERAAWSETITSAILEQNRAYDAKTKRS